MGDKSLQHGSTYNKETKIIFTSFTRSLTLADVILPSGNGSKDRPPAVNNGPKVGISRSLQGLGSVFDSEDVFLKWHGTYEALRWMSGKE